MSRDDSVVDDHLLLSLLLGEERLPGQEPADRPGQPGRIFTTGLWYHRLCRAVSVDAVTGVMSRSLGDAHPDVAAAAVRSLVELPEHIGLLSLRELAWPMGQLLREGVRLPLMSLEALAAAEQLDADLCLATDDDNQLLAAAAEQRGRSIRWL